MCVLTGDMCGVIKQCGVCVCDARVNKKKEKKKCKLFKVRRAEDPSLLLLLLFMYHNIKN